MLRRWRPMRSFLPLLIAAAVLSTPQTAGAAILDAPWSGSGTGTTSVVSDGSSSDPQFNFNALTAFSGAWTFSVVAASARSVPVAWEYSGFYSFFQVRAGLQRFVHRGSADILVETLIDLGPVNCCDAPSNGFNYQGTSTFADLQPGDVYGFRLTGSHNDGTQALYGSLVLHEVDATAPVVTPLVTGTEGANGYYKGPVSVDWTVTDDGSRITSQTGCEDATVSDDTAGTTITCSATSRGGVETQSVTIKKDATAPLLTTPPVVVQPGAGADGAIVAFDATATDAVDPSPSVACTPASGTRFPVGTTKVDCTASDAAGNETVKSFDAIVLPPVLVPVVPTTTVPTPTVQAPKPSNAILAFRYKVTKLTTRLTQLKLRDAPTGATVTITCKGRKCPKALTKAGTKLQNKAASLDLTRLVKAPLKAGTKILVEISSSSIVTTIKTLVIRKGKAPVASTTCRPAGATKPTAC